GGDGLLDLGTLTCAALEAPCTFSGVREDLGFFRLIALDLVSGRIFDLPASRIALEAAVRQQFDRNQCWITIQMGAAFSVGIRCTNDQIVVMQIKAEAEFSADGRDFALLTPCAAVPS